MNIQEGMQEQIEARKRMDELKESFTKALIRGKTPRQIRRKLGISLERYNAIMGIVPKTQSAAK